MISFFLLLLLAPLTISSALFAEDALEENAQSLLITRLQDEIKHLSDYQSDLTDQKKSIQEELRNTAMQLEQTRTEQARLSEGIALLNESSAQLSKENNHLSEQLSQVEKANAQLEKKITRLEIEKKQHEDTIAQVEAELTAAKTKTKELTRNKLEYEMRTAQETYRLQKNIIALEEKANDCSWDNAYEKHATKMIACFAAGSFMTYLLTHYIVPETA